MLRDVMSDLGLSTYPEVALVMFFLAFVGIIAYLLIRKKETWERVSRLPLEDTKSGDGSAPEGTEDRSDG